MNRPIVRIKFGSHLYGTNTPASDTDYKSVHMPEARDILLQRVPNEIVVGGRDKAEGERNTAADVDDKSYSLQKFLALAAEGQTLAIDMLFAPPEMIDTTSAYWSYIVANRHKLISRKSAAFLGYCRQQANKYGIKGSRVAAAQVAANMFNGIVDHGAGNRKVGDWKGALEQLCREHPEHMSIVEQAIGSSGQLGLFFDCCGRKVAFTAPCKQAAEIFSRIYENYGDRARLAQSNEGVDWKALSHAVRVGYEAIELLTTGYVTLPLPRADYIKDIKLGKLSYEEVSEKIEELLLRVERAADMSNLPDEPDHKFIDDLIMAAYSAKIAAADKEGEFGRLIRY